MINYLQFIKNIEKNIKIIIIAVINLVLDSDLERKINNSNQLSILDNHKNHFKMNLIIIRIYHKNHLKYF